MAAIFLFVNVIVTIAALDPAHGGPARTVPVLCRELAEKGAKVTLLTISEREQNCCSITPDGFRVEIIPTRTNRYRSRSWRAAFRAALERVSQNELPTVLYDVGLWLPSNHFVASFARKTRAPLVISPRGMLSKSALQVSHLRKKLAWQLYQKRDLEVARVLHATSDAEAADFRRRGLRQPIAVIPNGIDIPESSGERQPQVNGLRTALFLSRLHPIKGLRDLVEAWARVQPSGWQMVIAGPDEDGHRAEIEALLLRHELKHQFRFVGVVNDERKWALYRSAELFILPSHSESFGQVVAEALAVGLPVITTRATPWEEIDIRQCGWWIPTGPEALAIALSEATSAGGERLREMGRRGRQLVATGYSWDAVAQRHLDVFGWLIGRANRPGCVV